MQQFTLQELERIYREQRTSLKHLESRYDFSMAVMKAAPYFLISLITISVTLTLYAPDLFFIPLLVLGFILLLMALLYLAVNRYDDKTAVTQFELDEIKEGIDFRHKFLISAFVNYHQTMSTLPTSISEIDPNRYTLEGMAINVRAMFGPMRVEDMEYRHPNIFRSLLQFESAYESFREGMVSLSFRVKELSSLLEKGLSGIAGEEGVDQAYPSLKVFLDIQPAERARIVLNHVMGNHDYYSPYPLSSFKDVMNHMDEGLRSGFEDAIRKGEELLPFFQQYQARHASLSNDLVYRFGSN